MDNQASWLLSDEDKEKFISALTPELVLLRTKAGISQEELAVLIGTSRQTYGAIERQARRMSWSTFLSLIMFYDYNQKTHDIIRAIGAFPHEIIKHFNDGNDLREVEISSLVSEGMKPIIDCLDEQALRSIRTLVMVEYARCTDTPGDIVVKSFDGKHFNASTTPQMRVTEALRTIKEKNQEDDESRDPKESKRI